MDVLDRQIKRKVMTTHVAGEKKGREDRRSRVAMMHGSKRKRVAKERG